MSYSENQIIERLGKIGDDIRDCLEQIVHDLQRSNDLVNVGYLQKLGEVITTVDPSLVREQLIFARNILEDVGRILDSEEQRRRYSTELCALRSKNDLKTSRKRKRQEHMQDSPYKTKRQNSIS